jgi:hypothetical protein
MFLNVFIVTDVQQSKLECLSLALSGFSNICEYVLASFIPPPGKDVFFTFTAGVNVKSNFHSHYIEQRKLDCFSLTFFRVL